LDVGGAVIATKEQNKENEEEEAREHEQLCAELAG
jgi:hypothetical protein